MPESDIGMALLGALAETAKTEPGAGQALARGNGSARHAPLR